MTSILLRRPSFKSDRVILENISWYTYQSLLADFERSPAIRLTYDSGTLEIRMPLDVQESYKKLIGRLIEAATEELGLEVRSLGSKTCNREDLTSGLEPDQCYYIQNELLVRGVEQIDLNQLPPPDLAVEIDITSSSLDRFEIYKNLGVPEIWRFDGECLTINLLTDGGYSSVNQSIALIPLTAKDFSEFVARSKVVGENSLLRQFRATLRAKVKSM
ncbi:MAG: Uma2 family endonuclease [Cyanobacteria bacterium J06573_11]